MHTTTPDGIRIDYETRGEGPPLLLIAGLAGDRHAWDRQLPVYEQRYSCILVDNRGVGLSAKSPGPYSTRLLAQDAIAVLDDLGIEQAHVSGQSMGGAITQHIALGWPERVKSASIHCSWGSCGGHLRDVFASWSAIRRACSLEDYNRHVLTWILTPGFYDARPREVDEIRRGMDNPTDVQPWHTFDAQALACAEHDTLDLLASVGAPVLVTVGGGDIFTPPPLSAAIAERIPGAEFRVVAEAGHCLFWEQADQFNRITLEFLDRHS